jgi:hypothetical protein
MMNSSLKYESGYDDFMGLSGLDLTGKRLIVFTGISGSGKSSAIHYLINRIPEIDRQGYELIDGDKPEWGTHYKTKWIVIDEVVDIQNTWHIRQLLRKGHRLLVASHLPVSLFKLMCLGHPGLYLYTDRESRKLARYLENAGVVYDSSSLNHFVNRFGQSYNTLEVVLDYSRGNSLISSMEVFDRHCTLSLSRPR